MGQPLDNGIKQILPDGKTSCLFGLRRNCAGPAQQRLDADDEFLHPERLLQIIVGSHLKTVHHIVDRRAGGQEDDGRCLVALADAAHQFKAVQPWHHHVGHQHIGLVGGIQPQRFLSVTRHIHMEPLTIEGVLDNHRQGAFVLGQQYVNALLAHINRIVKDVPIPLVLDTSMLQPCFSTIVLT